MSIHQTVTFQEALDIVESLPEDQQEALVAVVRRRLMERRREVLSKHIEEARQELSLGEVRRGTVDDLSLEIEQVRNNPELLAFLAERSREKETFSLDDSSESSGYSDQFR
jgi:hypothetical protein